MLTLEEVQSTAAEIAADIADALTGGYDFYLEIYSDDGSQCVAMGAPFAAPTDTRTETRDDTTFALEVAEAACAEIRARGIEISALTFLDACRAADERLAAKHGPPPTLRDPDTLAKALCAIARENGWTLTYKLEAL